MSEQHNNWPDFKEMSDIWQFYLKTAIKADQGTEIIGTLNTVMLESAREIVKLRAEVEKLNRKLAALEAGDD